MKTKTQASKWLKAYLARTEPLESLALYKHSAGVPGGFYSLNSGHGCVQFRDGSCITYTWYDGKDVLKGTSVHASVEAAEAYVKANPVRRAEGV